MHSQMSPYLVKTHHGSPVSFALNYFRPALPLGSEQFHMVKTEGWHEKRFSIVITSHCSLKRGLPLYYVICPGFEI